MRALGWKRDWNDDRDFKFGEKFGEKAPPGVLSLLEHRLRGWDQRSTSSCVGFALARAIHVSWLVAGHSDAPEPSPAFLYANGRYAEQAGLNPDEATPIDDSGSYPRLVMQAAQRLGVCKVSDWPLDPSNPNRRPSLRAMRNAFDQSNLEYYRIDSSGPQRINDVRVALSKNYPVIFGMVVGDAFMRHDGDEPIDNVGEPVGGHMMCALAHDDAGVLTFCNSWGPDFGFNDGLGRMTDNLFGSPLLGDVYAVVDVPYYSRGT